MYVCWKCKKEREGEPHEHNCPFQSDVHNDRDFSCNCCDECTTRCREDI